MIYHFACKRGFRAVQCRSHWAGPQVRAPACQHRATSPGPQPQTHAFVGLGCLHNSQPHTEHPEDMHILPWVPSVSKRIPMDTTNAVKIHLKKNKYSAQCPYKDQ